MDIYNFLKSFLGIPNSVPPSDFNSERYKDYVQDGHDNLFRSEQEDESMGFQVFSSPLEMQRFFEQQISEVIKAFGIPSERSLFGEFFGEDQSAIEAPQSSSTQTSGSLRDQFLRPGFDSSQQKTDSDIDGKLNINEIDTILKKKDQEVTTYERPSVKKRFFGQSMSTKTIIRSDGTVETQRIMRDNEGNEERTVTCKNGDKEYTVITRTDKDGKQNREEKLVNINEAVVGEFSLIEPSGADQAGWFNFDNFFKW